VVEPLGVAEPEALAVDVVAVFVTEVVEAMELVETEPVTTDEAMLPVVIPVETMTTVPEVAGVEAEEPELMPGIVTAPVVDGVPDATTTGPVEVPVGTTVLWEPTTAVVAGVGRTTEDVPTGVV